MFKPPSETMPSIPNQRGGRPPVAMNNSNLSALNNNSRRNISLSAANMFVGGRPKTAAQQNLRPPTGMPSRGLNNMTGIGRAISANVAANPRVKRYEDIITRLKKMLGNEKKSLRMVRTLCSKEIEVKNQLEKVLRQCVDDDKGEIAKKRSENKSIYRKLSIV